MNDSRPHPKSNAKSSSAARKRTLQKGDSAMEKGATQNADGGTLQDKTSRDKLDTMQQSTQTSLTIFSPVVSLPLLVFIDMFAVALVVPLLFQYYKHAGVTSATQRELLSSVFSASQIVGGLMLGALSDAAILSKKTILFVSFGGSALSYLMITYGGFPALS